MCTFKITLIHSKSPEHLDVMQGYGTIADFFVKILGFYKMWGFSLKR